MMRIMIALSLLYCSLQQADHYLPYPYTTLQSHYCNATPSSLNYIPADPLKWAYSLFHSNFSEFSNELYGRYKAHSVGIYGVFIALSLIAWIMCVGIAFYNKICICFGKVPQKQTLKKRELIAGIILLGICEALAIVALVYSKHIGSYGNNFACSTATAIDEWEVGDSEFLGIHTFNYYLNSIYKGILKLNMSKENFPIYDKSITQNYSLTSASIQSMASMDALVVPNPKSKEGSIPEFLVNWNPLEKEGTIAYDINEWYDSIYSDIVSKAIKQMSQIQQIDYLKYNSSLFNMLDGFSEIDLYSGISNFTSNGMIKQNSILEQSTFVMELITSALIILFITDFFVELKWKSVLIGKVVFNAAILLSIANLVLNIWVFAAGANVSQICNTMTKAYQKNEEMSQLNVVQWITNVNSNQPYLIMRNCLFNSSISEYLMDYDYKGITGDLIKTQNIAGTFVNDYIMIDYREPYIYEIYDHLVKYMYDPTDQLYPDSEDVLSQLNSLTNINSTEECNIHDMWVYNNTDMLVCSGHPRYNSSIPIGEKACISVKGMEPTEFETRYSPYATKCDPDGKIKPLYTSLYNYANASFTVFQNVSQYYSAFLNYLIATNETLTVIFMAAVTYNENSVFQQQLVLNYTTIPKGSNSNTNCSLVYEAGKNANYHACKWVQTISIYCLCTTILSIISIFYAFLRVNIIRVKEMKLDYSSNEKQVKLLLSSGSDESKVKNK